MSRRSKYALVILEESRQPGVLTTGATSLIDGQAWINWRTAYALHDRGFVRVHPYGEADAEVMWA
jgi:hypothetical protein